MTTKVAIGFKSGAEIVISVEDPQAFIKSVLNTLRMCSTNPVGSQAWLLEPTVALQVTEIAYAIPVADRERTSP